MFGDDEDCTMKPSEVTDIYVETFFLRYNIEIKNAIDFHELDDLLWNLKPEYKARDAFAILEVHGKGTFTKGQEYTISNEALKVHQGAIDWLRDNYHMLLPEEVVMSLKLTKGAVFNKLAMNYLTS